MGRKKIEIKKIADEKTLLVTFAKRKKGLYNKAFELGELCDCEIAVIIFTNKNRVHTYSSHNLEETVKKYKSRTDRGEHSTRNDMIKFRERKSVSRDNIGSADYNSPSDINLNFFEPNSSRAPTTNSSDYFDDNGFQNGIIPEVFHNGGDSFPDHQNGYNAIDAPHGSAYDQPTTSTAGNSTALPYQQLDTKPNVCPPESAPSYMDTTPLPTNVYEYNEGCLKATWVRTTNNGPTSEKPPLETPDPQQIPKSPLRES